VLSESADKERVDEAEILAAARASQGLERMEDIKHAVVENDGRISVVPRKGASGGG
jgi:uncharacterized membrane protein YcaP (DUF421 family)